MSNKQFEKATKKDRISRTFHLETEQIVPLQQASKVMGVSQSEVVRRSINFFIDRLNKHAMKELNKKKSDA